MKRLITVLLAAVLLLTLFACGEKKSPDATGQESSDISTVSPESETDAVPATETETGSADPDVVKHDTEQTVVYYGPNGRVIKEEKVPPTDHIWRFESDAEGHRAVCVLCGKTEQTVPHDPDAQGVCTVCGYGCTHEFVDSVVQAGCTSAGYTEHKCSLCGYSYASDPVPAAGHKYSESVEVPATCTENGTARWVCSVCGDYFIQNDAFPATGHNYVNGYCTVCGARDPSAGPEIDVPPETSVETSGETPPPLVPGGPYELPEVPIG